MTSMPGSSEWSLCPALTETTPKQAQASGAIRPVIREHRKPQNDRERRLAGSGSHVDSRRAAKEEKPTTGKGVCADGGERDTARVLSKQPPGKARRSDAKGASFLRRW